MITTRRRFATKVPFDPGQATSTPDGVPSDQLGLLPKHEFRALWMQRAQVEAHVSERTELTP